MSQTSLIDNVLNTLRRRTSLREGLRLLRTSSKDSLKSNKSTKKRSSTYQPYTVYEQTMFPIILRDSEATQKLLEAILDSPAGRRSLSRLARTCRALSGPALDILWRELDSIAPIVGLFPGHLLKKTRKPGMGLSRLPRDEDWATISKYSERIQRITYDESANNVAPSIFSIFEECRPQGVTYILPRLQDLNWKVETPAALDHATIFIHPQLQVINLEIGGKFPKINDFLADMSSRTKLKGFSFISPTSLPDAFTELLLRQDELEKVILVAPGALGPGVGRWVASLPQLKELQLDLTGRSPIAVEGFFDELGPLSGYSTPSSIGSRDSGVFSGEEIDFTDIRKSTLRLTGDLPPKGFAKLKKLHLTGEVANIAVFLKHIDSALVHLDLVIEDPPDNADWQDLSELICDRFTQSLQSLKISATPSSKFADLVRSTSRAEPPSGRLSLEKFTGLSSLVRLDIDLPESIVFTASDIECLAKACPNLESLKLCPWSRFPPPNSPKLSLEALAPLMKNCKRLHTLAVVINAGPGSEEVLRSPDISSPSLQRLHLGHSWATDSLQISILLSHIMPKLELLKWFQEKNRAGFVEAHARAWQTVSETMPHLQVLRSIEKSFTQSPPPPPPPQKATTSEKGIDATVTKANRGVYAHVMTSEASIQFSPVLQDREVEAKVELSEISIDATPPRTEIGVEAKPVMVSTAIAAVVSAPQNEEAPLSSTSKHDCSPLPRPFQNVYLLSSLFTLLSFAYRYATLPVSFTSRILHLALSRFQDKNHQALETNETTKSPSSDADDAAFHEPTDSIPLDTLQIPTSMNTHAYDYAPMIHAIHFFPGTSFSKHKSNIEMDSESKRRGGPEVSFGTWMKELQTNDNNTATRHRDWIEKYQSTAAYKYTMADNKKQEKDFTKEVDALLPEAETLIKSGKLQDGLDKIFALEKQTRNAADLSSTTRLVKAAVQHSYDARDYPLLNSTISVLSKKHGQLKGAVSAIVELTISWLPEIKERDGLERWLELLETLRGVTEGKIFLETPRARVTLLLAHHHEGLSKSGKPTDAKESLQTASDLLSDLQVETYSSMERREKTEFILEQMRLLIAVAEQKDAEAEKKEGKESLGGGEAEWVKARVGGRKVNEEFLKEAANEDLKLKYYDLMIRHALHHSEYLDAAKYYHKVWETPSIKEDVNDKGKLALEHIVYYIVLAPHSNEQSDMLHHLYADPALTRLELHYNLVKCFVTTELMRWPGIVAIYGEFLRKTPVFSSEKRWEDLHTRVIEHNIRVVAQYYTRITLKRLTSLLDLTPKQTEQTLARLVVSGTVWAKVDRPAGIVNFRGKRSAEDVMNDWSSDMQKLLGLVEKTWMGMNAAQAAQSRVKS